MKTKRQAWYETGVGELAKKLIRDWHTNAEVLAIIKETFPEGGTTSKGVAYYRSQLRRDDKTVPSDSEARRRGAKIKAELRKGWRDADQEPPSPDPKKAKASPSANFGSKG